MKYRVIALFLLVIGAVIIAGCTQSTTPVAPATVQATPAPQAAITAEPKATFSIGQEYLHKKYSFSGSNTYPPETLRIDSDSWAVDYLMNPTSTDSQATWFEITVTDVNSGKSEKFGYGRTYPLDKHQQYPLYKSGSYQVEMKGNLVSVDVTIAKRNP